MRLVSSLLLSFLSSASVLAAPSDFQIGLGPFVGGGQISNGGHLRHTSGYVVSVERSWDIESGFSLGPRLEVGNAFVDVQKDIEGGKQLAAYDNRFIAGGISLNQALSAEEGASVLYATAVVGRGYSKLVIDESNHAMFRQSLYGGITGTYWGSELGAWIPLRGEFGLNLAVLGNSYNAKQSGASGTYEGEELGSSGLNLVQGTRLPGDGSLDEQVIMRTLSLKVGLALGF